VDGRDGPTFEIRPLRLGFGVEKGELGGRVGEERVREIGDGDDGTLLAYSPTCLIGLLALPFLELSCFAVMLAYLAALDPGVILSDSFFTSPFCPNVDFESWLDFTEGVTPGVTIPLDRPLTEGVVRPLERVREGIRDVERAGVIRPEIEEVLARPLLEDVTEDGRGAVG
jgi:hypothetical protein